MDPIAVLRPALHIVFTFLLIILFYLFWRTINSFWLKDSELREYNNLKKGEVEYQEPPRPNSENFIYLLELALMTTSTRQEHLTKYFAKLVKEYFEFDKTKYEMKDKEISKNLSELLNDPNLWLNKHFYHINSITAVNRREYAIRLFQEEYRQFLKEIEQLIDMNLVSDLK